MGCERKKKSMLLGKKASKSEVFPEGEGYLFFDNMLV